MAEPTPAVLASSLLQTTPVGQQQNTDEPGLEGPEGSPTWDLIDDIDTGVPLPPKDNVFSCGRVVGISGLRPVPSGRDENDGENNIQTWVFEISQHVLVNTLAGIPPSGRSYPRALLVQSLDSLPATRDSLSRSLQQRLPSYPLERISEIASRVQIYRAFDFDEFLRTITGISDMLNHIQQQLKQAATGPVGGDEQSTGNPANQKIEPVLVIIEGLDHSLEEVVRSSNPVTGQAKLTTVLRTLTTLSRTYAHFATIIVVNTISIPPVPSVSELHGRDYEAPSTQTPARIPTSEASGQINPDSSRKRYETRQNEHHYSQQSHPSIPIQSIFAQAPAPTTSAVVYPPLLARALDQGFDTHLLVSKVQGKMVIEVAKDRLGGNLGRWCAL